MRSYNVVVEKCNDTGLCVGYIPDFPGAHTQAETLEELDRNLQEVVEMLLEDEEPVFETNLSASTMFLLG
jgi:predicted RNase H-like HicB family nuclease